MFVAWLGCSDRRQRFGVFVILIGSYVILWKSIECDRKKVQEYPLFAEYWLTLDPLC
jgi:hypothetical protein